MHAAHSAGPQQCAGQGERVVTARGVVCELDGGCCGRDEHEVEYDEDDENGGYTRRGGA